MLNIMNYMYYKLKFIKIIIFALIFHSCTDDTVSLDFINIKNNQMIDEIITIKAFANIKIKSIEVWINNLLIERINTYTDKKNDHENIFIFKVNNCDYREGKNLITIKGLDSSLNFLKSISLQFINKKIYDCNNICNGNSYKDECGTCDNNKQNDCKIDCSGILGGSAIIDDCLICDTYIENNGIKPDFPYGICDCLGVPNGNAKIDMCNVCDSESNNDCIRDCLGVWGGKAYLDNCNICDTISTNNGLMFWGVCMEIEKTKSLDLSNSGIYGKIPEDIVKLKNLESLNLKSNKLTGEIPKNIRDIKKLKYLDLSNNQLSGYLNDEICFLKNNLLEFNIDNNNFCPPYPSCFEEEYNSQDISNCK